MFNPEYFRITDMSCIAGIIRENSLGILFSTSPESGMQASHIPFITDDSCKVLTGHMARANRQWEGLDGKNVLVVFLGPDHYISPEWYREEDPVPTWNYVTVHITGTFSAIRDEAGAAEVLDNITANFEEKYGTGWKADWASDIYSRMVPGIVPFRINVDRVEGKMKLSQNHGTQALMNVSAELRKAGSEKAEKIAALMESAAMKRQ